MELSNNCTNSGDQLDLHERAKQEVQEVKEGISKSNNASEEGMVYKCISLVEAIAAFDNETYNEEEDEDYLTPKERDMKLIQEVGPGDNCAPLVEAITAFDDEGYNEKEDEDYLTPKERDLKLIQEIGPGDNCASLVEAITAFDDE